MIIICRLRQFTNHQKAKLITPRLIYLYASNLQEAKDYPIKIVDIGGNDRVFIYEKGSLKTATDLGNGTYTSSDLPDGRQIITGPSGEKLEYK